MKRRKKLSKVMYGISRIDDVVHRTHAWRVSLRRQGKLHVKNFPDLTYGGKAKGLVAAKQFRDELVLKYPPTTRKAFCSVLRRNNKSGISGVYVYEKPYVLRDGSVKSNRYWEANWPLGNSQSAKIAYSVKTYGEAKAKQLAIRARKEGLSQIEGVLWSSERGCVETLESTD